jgi:hypothetical protein
MNYSWVSLCDENGGVAVRGSVRQSLENGNHDNREYKPHHNRKTSAQKSAKRRKYKAEQYKD